MNSLTKRILWTYTHNNNKLQKLGTLPARKALRDSVIRLMDYSEECSCRSPTVFPHRWRRQAQHVATYQLTRMDAAVWPELGPYWCVRTAIVYVADCRCYGFCIALSFWRNATSTHKAVRHTELRRRLRLAMWQSASSTCGYLMAASPARRLRALLTLPLRASPLLIRHVKTPTGHHVLWSFPLPPPTPA